MSREGYRTLAEKRCKVNVAFGQRDVTIDAQRIDALPEQGVPQQFLECAVHMPEV